MPIDTRTLNQDSLPCWAAEPPVPPDGSLVPGSQFHEEQWIMAAGMLARGNSFQQVARAMGCSRTTLWRAYYGSKPLRVRVWWERQALSREAELRLSSLRALVAEQIERLVASGDPSTVRWLAERLGLFTGLDAMAGAGRAHSPAPAPVPAPVAAAESSADPFGPTPFAVTVPELDDDLPGALRERLPPDAATIAAILACPEAAGPKGVYPWTLNPDEPFPNLAPVPEARRGSRRGAAFSRRL
ncbi:hypothetical protein ABMY26_29885 [Azospirillum sp. HJ39]|uniref:hypothetical protein n=1 Tax=Azospirillum sp. HJ39 TaxID=3159496 RepID=UPI003557C26A